MQTMSGNYPAFCMMICFLTDVGSVKTGIHEQIQKFPDLERHFIGGHPMCGTEHVGYEYSTAYMLENAYYILTPTHTVSPQKVDEFEHFVTSIGCGSIDSGL